MIKKTKVKFVEVAADMESRIIRAMNETWEYIGHDIIQSTADEEEININDVSIPKADVIEMVLDADHMSYGSRDKEAYEICKSLPYEQRLSIGKRAFVHSSYGM